jgi:hypothetical protein
MGELRRLYFCSFVNEHSDIWQLDFLAIWKMIKNFAVPEA